MNHYRHGDVLLTRIDALPSATKEKHSGQFILAHGEVTGHAHRLTVKNPSKMKVLHKEGTIYFMLMEVGTLTHEEHKTLEIPVGIYRVSKEREWDYALESIRQTAD